MEKRYLLLLSVVAAASYGLGEADLLEAQAAQVDHVQRVEVQISAAGKTALAGLVNDELCPSIEDAFQLTQGTCTAAKVAQRLVGNIDFHQQTNGEYLMGAQLRLPGSLVVSMP